MRRLGRSVPGRGISESTACLDRLDRVAQDYPAPKSCAWSDIHRFSALAHAALSQNRRQSAISILKKLQQEAHEAHAHYYGLRVGTHLATASLRAGDRAGALVALRKVLNVGVEAGLYQVIEAAKILAIERSRVPLNSSADC
jgi:LuxR family transcriptional regulator, maltose regulon positive regulatory protein